MLLKTLNIVLAFFFLISSSGLIVNKHFCQKELKSTSLFVSPQSCHEKNKSKSCHHSQQKTASCQHQSAEEENQCCNTASEYIKLEQDQPQPFLASDWVNQPALLGVLFVALQINPPASKATSLHYLSYKPPIVRENISVLLQTFLL